MEALSQVTIVFTLALALTLLIERFLEVLKSVYNLLDSINDWYIFWNGKTQKLKIKLEKRLKIFEYMDTKSIASSLYKFREMLIGKTDEKMSNTPVLSGDLVRTFYTKIAFKSIGILVGIGMAFWFKIDLFKIWKETAIDNINIEANSFELILTGIAMGLGAGPMHKLITAIEKKRIKNEKRKLT